MQQILNHLLATLVAGLLDLANPRLGFGVGFLLGGLVSLCVLSLYIGFSMYVFYPFIVSCCSFDGCGTTGGQKENEEGGGIRRRRGGGIKGRREKGQKGKTYLGFKLLELGFLLRLVRFYLLLGFVARFADALCAVCSICLLVYNSTGLGHD